jgi:hypothetical protein
MVAGRINLNLTPAPNQRDRRMMRKTRFARFGIMRRALIAASGEAD